MTNERTEGTEQAETIGLLLRADDGTAYLIPQAALEQFRLTDEGKAAVESQQAEAGDVQGHGQYIGQFSMTMPVWRHVTSQWGYWSTEPYRTHTSTYYPPLR